MLNFVVTSVPSRDGLEKILEKGDSREFFSREGTLVVTKTKKNNLEKKKWKKIEIELLKIG